MHAPDPDVADVGLISSVDMGVACETGRGVCRQFQLLGGLCPLMTSSFLEDDHVTPTSWTPLHTLHLQTPWSGGIFLR